MDAMTALLVPSTSRFVVPVTGTYESRRLAQLLSRFGSVQALDGETLLLRVDHPRSARDTWQEISSVLPREKGAFPAYVDQDDRIQYPTGSVNVRFVAEPDERGLQAFSGDYHLALAGRSKFVRVQIQFRFQEPGRIYLPDFVEKIKRDPRVSNAWADTKSEFDRT